MSGQTKACTICAYPDDTHECARWDTYPAIAASPSTEVINVVPDAFGSVDVSIDTVPVVAFNRHGRPLVIEANRLRTSWAQQGAHDLLIDWERQPLTEAQVHQFVASIVEWGRLSEISNLAGLVNRGRAVVASEDAIREDLLALVRKHGATP
ncbi:hypothetical protein ACNI3K_06850 [Demequina sp. SO4-13]|uniref:hypothetical protein n=1 Tax=Demequina sp. SO4-13 TaxID=3401027 RepID=UPI003AF56318